MSICHQTKEYFRSFAFYAAITLAVGAAFILYEAGGKASRKVRNLEDALSGTPTAILACDKEGRIIFVNERVLQYTGYTFDELRTGGVTLLIAPALEKHHAEAFTKRMCSPDIQYGNHSIHRKVEICTKSGGRVPAALQLRIINTDDGPIAFAYLLPFSVMQEALAYPEFEITKP